MVGICLGSLFAVVCAPCSQAKDPEIVKETPPWENPNLRQSTLLPTPPPPPHSYSLPNPSTQIPFSLLQNSVPKFDFLGIYERHFTCF